jgi:hypothetical protein
LGDISQGVANRPRPHTQARQKKDRHARLFPNFMYNTIFNNERKIEAERKIETRIKTKK